MQEDYEYLFKIIIIGDSGVGKSSLLFRFVDDSYNNNYISTIGVDFKIKKLFLNGKIIKLQIWDTAGQERFRTITTSYYRGAHIIFVCYDITDVQSFTNLEMWLKEVEKYASPNVQVVLCGTKNDLESKREVKFEDAKKYADLYGYTIFETSSKDDKNVNDLFDKSCTKMLEYFMQQLSDDSSKKKNQT